MTVVYLHAIGLDHHLWHGVREASSVALDLPGHGVEPRLPQPPTFDRLVDHLELTIPEPVHLVGISLGGMLAQHFALKRPGKVRSLVLACAGAVTPRDVIMRRASDQRNSTMAETLASTLERWFTPDALAKEDHSGVNYARQRLLKADPKIVADYWETIAEHDLRDRLHSIAVPTTVIAATEDRSFPMTALQDLKARIPGARLREIGAPHLAPLERPEAFAELVTDHLAWAVASP